MRQSFVSKAIINAQIEDDDAPKRMIEAFKVAQPLVAFLNE